MPEDLERLTNGSPFDFKLLDSSWERGGGHVLYDITVKMWTRWRLRDLDCELPVCAISLDFDSKGNRRPDYVMVFKRDGSKLSLNSTN